VINKNICVLILLLVSLLAIGTVSAGDNITDDFIGVNDTSSDVVAVEDTVDDVVRVNQSNDELTYGSYSDLKNKIDDAYSYSTVYLYDDYYFDEYYDYYYDYQYPSEITISKQITIDGQGHTIDANNYCNIFDIDSSNVVLKNIIFKNGYSGYGGAICGYYSNIELNNCTFENCYASDYGGAVYLSSYTKIINCKFNNNDASDYGGAVYLSGSYNSIIGSSFSSNAAYNGGAVYLSSYDNSITTSSFSSNNATYRGGAVYLSSSGNTFDKCKFNSNKANYGGAMYVSDSNNEISNSEFRNDVAEYGSEISFYSGMCTINNTSFNGAKSNYNKYFYSSYKSNPGLSIDADNIGLGEKFNFTINYNNGFSGKVNITIFSIDLNKTVKSLQKTLPQGYNSYIISFNDKFARGQYLIKVSSEGNDFYYAQLVSEYFKVLGYDSSIDFNVKNITWGTPVVLNPTVTKGATGLISVYVNNELVNNFTVGSKYTLIGLGGPYSYIKLVYLGDKNYESSNATKTIYVERLNSTCEVLEPVGSGYTSPITVKLNEDANGEIKVSLSSYSYYYGSYTEDSFHDGKVVNGTYSFNETRLKAGNKLIKIEYCGDSKYNDFTKNKTIDVQFKTPVIHLDIDNVIFGENVNIMPYIDSNAQGSFEIYVDEIYITSLYHGESYTLNKPSLGKHDVRVTYHDPNGYYADGEYSTTFRVFIKEPIVPNNLQIIHNTDKYLNATFYDEYGQPLIGKRVSFIVNGTPYYYTTDLNGSAVLNKKFDIGIYDLEICSLYVSHSKFCDFTIFTSIQSENQVRYYNSGFDFNATLLDEDATPLINGYAVFKYNGIEHTPVVTDGNGEARLIVPLDVGNYNIEIENGKTGESAKFKLTIVSSIDSEDMSRAYNSDKDFSAQFYDVDGSYLANQLVTFEINSKQYVVWTDDYGVAILNARLDVGEYNITSINPATNQRTINKLNIVERIIDNEDLVVYSDKQSSFSVRLVDDKATVCGSGETVVFNINDVDYNVKTDSKGRASLKITEKPGKYTITASYRGYQTKNTVYVLEKVKSVITIAAKNIKYNENEILNITISPSFLDGNVVINITGKNGYEKVFRQNARELIAKELSGLNASTYTVKVVYEDFINFYAAEASKTFTVSKINPNIVVDVKGAEYAKDSTITVNIPGATGNVAINVGDKLKYNDTMTKNGVIIKKISTLRVGSYKVTVTYNGDNNYNKLSKTATLNVTRGAVGFYVDVKNVNYGNNVIVNVYSSFDGSVKLTIGKTVKTVNVTAKKDVNVSFGKLNAGKYTVVGNITPKDKKMEITDDSMNFEVKKVVPTVTVTADNIEVGKTAKITVNVPSGATGTVKLEINNQTYTQNVSSAKATFEIKNLKIGSYNIKATYNGNVNYKSASKTSKLNVTKIKSYTFRVPANISIFEGDYELVLPADATGSVTVTIDGKDYTSKVSNGKATLQLPRLSEGDHKYTVKYSSDAKYNAYSTQKTVSFVKITTTAKDMTVKAGSGYDYQAKFYDDNGNILANTPVKFTVNNKEFTVTTDNNGVATLNVGLGNGTYQITSTNPKTGEKTTNKLVIDGGLRKAVIAASKVSTSYKVTKKLVIKLKDVLDNPISGASLTITIKGKNYIVSTDAKGQAKFDVSKLKPKKYTASISYSGNAKYSAATHKVAVEVKKAKLKLKASKKTYKADEKTKKYKITLKTKNKKAVKKAKLTLKIDGKKFTAKTNKKGVATFKITKFTKTGTFKTAIKFKGSKYYKSASKKVKITIK